MLQAAIGFLQRHPDMRFVVIGASGASFEGVTLDIPEALRDRLEFRGQINDAGPIHAACRQARFLLFPSFYEASPLPPVEAMTFGCPVIASRIPSLTERCGEAALYCAPDDQDAIAAAIDSLMDDTTWQTQSQAARTQAAGFTWEAQATGLLALCGTVA